MCIRTPSLTKAINGSEPSGIQFCRTNSDGQQKTEKIFLSHSVIAVYNSFESCKGSVELVLKLDLFTPDVLSNTGRRRKLIGWSFEL